jgi:hypothetical protein
MLSSFFYIVILTLVSKAFQSVLLHFVEGSIREAAWTGGADDLWVILSYQIGYGPILVA